MPVKTNLGKKPMDQVQETMNAIATDSVNRAPRSIDTGIWLALAAIGVLMLIGSFSWRVNHDFSLLSYTGFLMDRYGAIPYKDIFETSMPGTFLFHYLLEHFFGHSDLTFRLVDVAALLLLNSITYRFIKSFGKTAALWAILLFDVVYLSQGQSICLQRDYLGLFPVAAALQFLPSTTTRQIRILDFAWPGLLFGVASTFKPHLVVAWPLFFWTQLRCSQQKVSINKILTFGLGAICSMLLPWIFFLVWLSAHGALQDFIDILTNYLPLHNQINGKLEVMQPENRLRYLLENGFELGGCQAMFFVCLMACHRVAREFVLPPALQSRLLCIGGATLIYSIYPVIAGKFWDYHYLPLVYFSSLGCGLMASKLETLQSMTHLRTHRNYWGSMGGIVGLAVIVQSTLPIAAIRAMKDIQSLYHPSQRHAPSNGRSDEIASFLRENLRHGETVQPLDWTGGVKLGMLLAEAPLATRYMYDYHFYHHVASPEIQKLRVDFIEKLSMAKPRFVIEVPGVEKPWVSGFGVSHQFIELQNYLKLHYRVRVKKLDYLIYEFVS